MLCVACGGTEKGLRVMISSTFRQSKWSATEGTLGRLLLKYIPTDTKNGIMNCYFLVSNVAFSQQCFSKMLLEKSTNQVFASVTVFQITFFPPRREKGHTKSRVSRGEEKPVSQEIVGFKKSNLTGIDPN